MTAALMTRTDPVPKKATVLDWLATDPNAPRVFSPATLMAYLETRVLVLARPTVMMALADWAAHDRVDRVRRGIYLNLMAQPTPELAEAASWVRKGAIVSLQYVLGQAGVLRHSSDWVTAVFPLTSSHAVGTFRIGGRVFQFAGMRPDLLPNPEGVSVYCQDAYDDEARMPTATPEKALLDWLYLARTSPLWKAPDPARLDLTRLERPRLVRLAHHMGLGDALTQFDAQADWGQAPTVVVPLRRGAWRT